MVNITRYGRNLVIILLLQHTTVIIFDFLNIIYSNKIINLVLAI